MTCKNGKYENGVPVCDKGERMHLIKCMKGGMPCYEPRSENVRKGVKKK